jgi:N-methylhydantoinase B
VDILFLALKGGSGAAWTADGYDHIGLNGGDGIEEEAKTFGFFGGKEGVVNRIELTYPDGSVRTAKSKQIIRNIPKGTLFRQIAGGGGGYGKPFERPEEKVLEEVRNEVISVEKARIDYGVLIDPSTMTIDKEATSKLRGGKK